MLYRDIAALRDFVAAHPDFHETHCGGSDIACRVSLKVLDYLEEHRLCDNAARQGAKLKEALADLMRNNPKIIREVRGVGLMVGLEYVEEFLGPMMSDALAKHGVFAAYSGNAPQVMRFMVPITVSDAELDDIIAAIRGAVKDMKTLLPLALLAAKIPGVLKLLNNEKIQTNLFTYVRKLEDLWHRGTGRQ
jgi:acetylornithine/succinyldiaminopimelate/putrescine aminotransferase